MKRLLLLVLCVATAAMHAGVPLDPNTTRGFAGKVYQLGELDNINVFNGNLTLQIPIGQTYTVGPSLSYQFVLTNNSKVWDYEKTSDNKRRPIPESYSDAGLGWSMSLGRLLPPSGLQFNPHGWIYVGPDGGHHEFTKFPNATVRYTQDGSYLRLTLDSATNTHTVEFPDGTIREFHANDPLEGRLKKIRDRFGNYVAVAYGSVSCGGVSCDQWTITDGHGTASGRTHTVTFANKSGKYNDANFKQVVSTVTLAAFDGATATYTFHYQDDGNPAGTQIPRKTCGEADEWGDALVPLLSGVTLPDGSQFGMQYATASCWSGGAERLTLPSGGALAWEYGDYFSTLQDCNDQDFWLAGYFGIKKRSLYVSQAAGAQPVGVWTYTSTLGPNVAPGQYQQMCNGQNGVWVPYAPGEVTTTVVDPSGDKTVHYFSVYPPQALPDPTGTFNGIEYSLPFSRNDELETDGRALSSAVYDCTNAGCTDGGTLQRKKYVEYETDGFTLGSQNNSRLKKQRVLDVTDTGCTGGCYVESSNSDWDGYGHYRQTITSSNIPTSLNRTTSTNYNPGSLPTGLDSQGALYFAPGEAWILGSYTETWVTEDSKTRKTLTVFDSNTGVLTSARTLRDVNGNATQLDLANSDVLSATCRNNRGFVTSERYFGGDRANLPGTDPCSASRGLGHYFINHSYTFSGTALTGHTAQYDGASHLIADETFDTSTGRVKSSRDTAGIETTYLYDTSGRLTAVMPSGEASTTYKYEVTATPPKLTVRNCGPGLSTCDTGSLTESRFYYDGLGRMTEERRRMPSGQWSASWATYDAMGRAATQSIPVTTASGDSGSNVSTASTSFLYDFLGRVTRETRPDTSRTTFSYSGIREKAISVANSPSHLAQLRSTEHYDGAGRLRKVIQPSGPTSATSPQGSNVTTEYKYDFADRLVEVKMTGAETGAPVQTRTFAYDGTGFLKEESHPEIGTTTYTTYDARGHARYKLPPGGHSVFKHQYTYDHAERLTEVATGSPFWDGVSSTGEYRPEKTFVFADANEGSNMKKGRLEYAIRENYRPCVGMNCWGDRVRVTEKYEYDLLGRKASRVTTIDDLPSSTPVLIRSIQQTFSYNSLGLLSSVNYPTCDDCGVPPSGPPGRDIPLTYSEGLLQSVGGYVPSLTYAATGTATTIAHDNGMTDSVTLDSSGRPKTITFGTWSSCGTPPSISIPPGNQSIPSETSTMLQVTASGSSLQYQWYDATASTPVAIPGATAFQYTTPVLTSTKSYFVRISNACKTIDSATVTITVTCVPPSITTPPQSTTIASGSSTTLSVAAAGTSKSYQWYQGLSGDTSQPVGTSSSQFTTPMLTATTRYWVRVSAACGTPVNSNSAIVTVPLPAPTNLNALKVSSTTIQLTWTNATGAAKYEVWARSGSTTFSMLTNNAQSGWIHTGIPGKTYVYKVYAVDLDNGSTSPASNLDLATLLDFTPVTVGTNVNFDQWEQLRTALNALRVANGDSALSWTQLLPPSVPEPALATEVRRAHLEALRSQFTGALESLGMPAPGYTNPNLTTEPLIRAVHVTELQERVK